MEAKDKAKELYSKFYSPLLFYKDGLNINEVKAMQECAKQCTLIAVDEIIKSWNEDLYINCGASLYWQEVKQEIEKL